MSNAASPADALPAHWVDQLFRKLSIRYGRQFMARWDGIDEADVKADWAEVLGGFVRRPDCIAYAMEHLPVDKPPTAAQFRELCRSMPAEREVYRALPSPRDPMPAHIKAKFQAMVGRMKGGAA